MANSRQAKKRARQADKRRMHNASRKSTMRTYIKKVVIAVDNGNKEEALSAYVSASSMLDKLANKGLIHKNQANRSKSRLNTRIKNMAA